MYDVEFDRDLIEASFAAQYGIRLAREVDMPYAEWARLLAGLLPETPLGRVVQLRAEHEPKAIARMNPQQRAMRRAWQRFCAERQSREEAALGLLQLQKELALRFGAGGETAGQA